MSYALAERVSPFQRLLRTSGYATGDLHGVATVDAKTRTARHDLEGAPVVSLRRAMLRDHLSNLLGQWHDETQFSSSLAAKKAHPAYKAIVALGEEAIPLILDVLEEGPDFIFMALHDITGEDPVHVEHHGRLPAMLQDWLNWGTEHGYRQ